MKRMMTKHIEPKRLLLYLLDECSVSDREGIEAHLKNCEACRKLRTEEESFIRLMREKPAFMPKESFVEASRRRLREGLNETERVKRQPGTRGIWEIVPEFVHTRRLAAVIAVFLIGLVFGRFSHMHIGGQGMKEQALLSLSGAIPASDFHINTSAERSNQIEIRFRTVQEHVIQGNLDDPDIQYALAYALVNASKDNVRLKSVDFLEAVRHDEMVEKALIHAIEKDDNPGVRIKAMNLLKRLPLNEDIKKILLYALFRDPNTGIQNQAAEALIQLDDEKLLPILQKRAQEDEYTRALIARMFMESGTTLNKRM